MLLKFVRLYGNRKLTKVLLCLVLSFVFFLTMLSLPPVPAYANATVTADFSVSNGTGHPYVFGGTVGNLRNEDNIKTVGSAVGHSLIRGGLNIPGIVPQTTIQDYLNNTNNVQDPSTWDFSGLSWIDSFNNLGFRVMAIMSYTPTWLSYNGTTKSPPKNWTVWEDIVTKVYAHVQGKVNYIEPWNEPDLSKFLSLTGSPYSSRLAAYKDIYKHTADAIRTIDSTIRIGGPTNYHPNTNWADNMLSDSSINGNINFLSYHDYGNASTVEAVDDYQAVAATHGRPNMPVFITEWNYSAPFPDEPMNNDSTNAISFVGDRLTNMYKQGLNGATIYRFGDAAVNNNYFFIYSDGTLVPKSATFRLLSVKLGLSEGTSVINGISYSNISNAQASTNSRGDKLVWLVNNSTSANTTDITLDGLGNVEKLTAMVYEASAANDAMITDMKKVLTVTNGSSTTSVNMPAKSVIGLYISNNFAVNPGFEDGNEWTPGGWGSKSIVKNKYNARSGEYLGKIVGAGGHEQVVSGLTPNTTYIWRGYVKTGNSAEPIRVGVKDYDGSAPAIKDAITTSSYSQGEVQFTTGPTNTTAKVFFAKQGTANGFGDDFKLFPAQTVNLADNPGFETGNTWSPGGWGANSVVTNNARSGSHSGRIAGAGGHEQVVSGLTPNTTYIWEGYVKTGNSAEPIRIGVKDYDGSAPAIKDAITTSSYNRGEVQFTTGPTNTTAKVFFAKQGTANGYGDDFKLVQVN